MNPGPKPQPRPRAKIVIRDLDRGVPVSANYSHTSYRLDPVRRQKLAKIANRLHGGVTMSQAFRVMIDERYREMFGKDEL